MNTLETPVLGCDRCRTPPATRNELVLDHQRTLYLESHEGYTLCRCRDCGQMFLEQFHEIIDWDGGEDDLWQRWMPLTSEELSEVEHLFPEERTEYDDVPALCAMMHRRGRLTRDPEGDFFWSEEAWDAGNLLPSG